MKWIVEATGNVMLFCEALESRCCRVVMVVSHQFQINSRLVKKTDKHDAKAPAGFSAKGLLPGSLMKEKILARVEGLGQTRDKLGKLRIA